MPGAEISLAFFAAALFLAIAPGPDNIFVLTQSACYGARAGAATTFGLVSGLCFHTLAVALGVAVLLRESPLAFTILKFMGAAYLCWLAWQAFQAGASNTAQHGNGAFPGYGALFRRGILMNVTNPKVCMFFLAFLPQFCVAGHGPMAWQIIYFGILFMIATLVVFCSVALFGGKLRHWLNNSARTQIIMHRITACIFLALALIIVTVE